MDTKSHDNKNIDTDWILDFIEKQLKERDKRLARERAYDLVKSLLEKNTPIDLIREITNCTFDEIEMIRKETNIIKHY